MTLGERCDEIVRLIDATLADCAESAVEVAGRGPESTPVGDPPTLSRARALAKARRPGLSRSA